MGNPLIIIPTFNEAENINPLLQRIYDACAEIHVLFVDDNSQDGTRKVIREHMQSRPTQIHLLERSGKLGLGTAYIAGFKWALAREYTSITEMDADLSHAPEELPAILALLKRYDVVIGSRYIRGGGTRNWSFLRKIISRSGSLFAGFVLGLSNIRDLTGGYNTWRRSVLEAIDLDEIKSKGYAFQIELKYRAHLRGFSLIEKSIIFEDRRAGESKMSGGIVLEAMLRVFSLRKIKSKIK